MVVVVRRAQVRLACSKPFGYLDVQESISHTKARFQFRPLLDMLHFRRQLRTHSAIHVLVALVNMVVSMIIVIKIWVDLRESYRALGFSREARRNRVHKVSSFLVKETFYLNKLKTIMGFWGFGVLGF